MRSLRRVDLTICYCTVVGIAMPIAAHSADLEVISEIIVTASKRVERLQDVPASVTAVAVADLAQIGAVRFEDYAARVPGLTLNDARSGGGLSQVTIRGITTGPGGSPTVGFYIDDAPFGSSTVLGGGAIYAPDLDPSDLQRVEVLRGPQGTLYGAGAMGGLVKFVTTPPDSSALSARIQVDGASVDGGASGYGVRGALNLPINDVLAIRASGFTREDPGFIDDDASGRRDVNRARFDGGRLSAAWQVSEAWTARLSAMSQRMDSEGTATIDVDAVTFQPLHADLTHARTPGAEAADATYDLYDLRIEGDLHGLELVSATSYGALRTDVNTDFTPSVGPVLEAFFGVPNAGAVLRSQVNLDKFAQELRLSSPSTQRLAWQVGAFYTHEEVDTAQSAAPVDAGTGEPLTVSLPLLLDAAIPSKFEEAAIFGDVTWTLTPRFDITLGLRYSRNEQSATIAASGLLVGGASSFDVVSDDSAPTYLLTPRMRINDSLMLYARVASGYRPGGPNIVVPGVAPTYDPDTVVNYEAGLKAELLGGRGSFDLAIFHVDWQDVQLRQISPLGTQFFSNGGEARSEGVEASLALHPAAGLQIVGNVSYTDAELAQDLPAPTAGAKGDRLPGTPQWSGQLSVDYEFSLTGAWSAQAGAGYRYVGDRSGDFRTTALTPRFPLDAYETIDLRAGVRHDRWNLMAYAKNVGDTRGQISAFPFGNAYAVSLAQPRTYGFSVAVDF